ncbi:MAG: SIR2-like domain-containing protein [uncultured Sulfurovum sp.]|uniref:SIR2-like domain-containing protein n=1 Tax=uncultured Sulfurovum sp. TaxID=269237 RepID=A0A6S6SV68_9BACT|nr:MAG: SIR2-like domain-containing protein [uncultured Sulfurovum sp.]
MDGLKKFDRLNMSPNNTDISELLEKIASGNAILFTGAGFSLGSENVLGEEPPTVKKLTDIIANEGGFDGENNLKSTANYFLKVNDDSVLIKILSELYTIKKISPSHKAILTPKWRRIYTTNYDNVISLAMMDNGKVVKNITTDDSSETYFKEDNVCVNINGSIETLKNDVIPDSFKLTTSSYLSPDSFITSRWFPSFKKDLERSSAIVFVGYSLYDIEIQKILFESPEFKKKTYFINHKSASPLTLFELSEFGKVYTTGVDGFAKEIVNNLQKYVREEEAFYLESFTEYKLEKHTETIRDHQIIEFLLHGNIENFFIDDSITSKLMNPHIVMRDQLNEVNELFKNFNYVTILSDFGNGKTVFLREMISYLTINGKRVFEFNDIDGDYSKDIEQLSSLNCELYVVIDNYEMYIEVLQNILLLNDPKIYVLLSTRSSNHDQNMQLIDKSDQIAQVNIDLLNDNEISDLNNIIDTVGLWSERAGLPEQRRFDLIKENNKSQFSHTLLNILQAPQIRDRIANLLSSLFKKEDNKDTILAICILEIMNIPLTYNNISEIALNNSIYNTELINNTDFKQLFPSKNNQIISKSSLFARNLLAYHFNPNSTVTKLLEVAEKFHSVRNNSEFEKKIYKSLLRFAFIERVVPLTNKRDMLIRYYEQLKSRLGGLKNTPHFWLQYAMARIALDDYNNAQNYLETAYAKAYGDYDTAYLDAQQARLWIKLSITEFDQNKSMDYFKKAHNLLCNLYDDQYKYRQVEAYLEYYDTKYTKLSKKNKANFLNAVIEMHKKLQELRKGYTTESNRMDHCYNKLDHILQNT